MRVCNVVLQVCNKRQTTPEQRRILHVHAEKGGNARRSEHAVA